MNDLERLARAGLDGSAVGPTCGFTKAVLQELLNVSEGMALKGMDRKHHGGDVLDIFQAMIQSILDEDKP